MEEVIDLKMKNKVIYLIMTIEVVIDQIIKYIICSNLDLFQSLKVIDNLFYITYVENDGAAWSILSGGRIFLILVSFIVMYLFYAFFIKNKKLNLTEKITYGILYGGIIGNLLDRLLRGSVIDYLDVRIFNYNFPVFNFADICIVISIIILGFLIFRGEKNENKNKWRTN